MGLATAAGLPPVTFTHHKKTEGSLSSPAYATHPLLPFLGQQKLDQGLELIGTLE